MSAETRRNILTFCGAIAVFAISAVCLSNFLPNTDDPISRGSIFLSRITVVSLIIIVSIMAGLAIIYNILGLTSNNQPLGLPEGSIRALISFSLLLIFVCMSSFLYLSLSSGDLVSPGVDLHGLSQSQIDDLKSHFTVVYQPSRTGNPKFDQGSDGLTQLYNATYYMKRGTSGDDFAKQLFTTLATVFVSVVGFYFGSSTTSSAIAAANNARQTVGDKSSGGRSGEGGQTTVGGSAGASSATSGQVARQAGNPPGLTTPGISPANSPEVGQSGTGTSSSHSTASGGGSSGTALQQPEVPPKESQSGAATSKVSPANPPGGGQSKP